VSFDYIAQANQSRKAQQLWRQPQALQSGAGRFVEHNGKRLINFSSNDYLGLAQDPQVISALNTGAAQYGVGSGGSPLVTGYQRPHQQLERMLCQWLGFERCILFSSGFAANNAVIQALFSDGLSKLTAKHESKLLIQDKLIHASLIDAATSNNVKAKRFVHNDINSLQQRLSAPSEHKLVATEGVFSMDGDMAPLGQISELCQQHQAWLMVDDAHGIGVLGQDGAGSLSLTKETQPSVQGQVHMATFGKAIGTHGAFVGGSSEFIEYLIQHARHYIYSTALPAALAVATMKSIELIRKQSQRRDQLNHLIGYFKTKMNTLGLSDNGSVSAIQPIIIGSAEKALTISQTLKLQGIWLSAIRPPTVAANTSRLRVTLTSQHQTEDIDLLFRHLEGLL